MEIHALLLLPLNQFVKETWSDGHLNAYFELSQSVVFFLAIFVPGRVVIPHHASSYRPIKSNMKLSLGASWQALLKAQTESLRCQVILLFRDWILFLGIFQYE